MSESHRLRTFKNFKDGLLDIIVATDIMARGVDVPECDIIIQIQPKEDIDMYLTSYVATSYYIVQNSKCDWMELKHLNIS